MTSSPTSDSSDVNQAIQALKLADEQDDIDHAKFPLETLLSISRQPERRDELLGPELFELCLKFFAKSSEEDSVDNGQIRLRTLRCIGNLLADNGRSKIDRYSLKVLSDLPEIKTAIFYYRTMRPCGCCVSK